jgi:hypothetical protein
MWWDDTHPRLKFMPTIQGIRDPGFCRKHKPGAYTATNEQREAFAIGIQPITDGDEYCGEFRPREE